jgi:nitroreductase
VLAFLSKPGSTALDTEENLIATSCFVQSFLLAAWEHGIGARWASIGSTQSGRGILQVPDDYAVVGVFGVGFPMEIPAAKSRTPIEEKIKHLP